MAFNTRIVLDQPEAATVGQQVQIMQIHLSLLEPQAIHIGYVVGTVQANGNVAAKRSGTVRVPFDEVLTRLPSWTTVPKLLRDLIGVSVALLQQAGEIGSGSPP